MNQFSFMPIMRFSPFHSSFESFSRTVRSSIPRAAAASATVTIGFFCIFCTYLLIPLSPPASAFQHNYTCISGDPVSFCDTSGGGYFTIRFKGECYAWGFLTSKQQLTPKVHSQIYPLETQQWPYSSAKLRSAIRISGGTRSGTSERHPLLR